MKKVMIWALGLVTLGAASVAGGWVYATSNVATPAYKVLKTDGDIEIRQYPVLRIAEIERTGDRREAVRAGFRPLARYIFAREREGEKIAMTAPVTQIVENDRWLVHFIMPAQYTLADLPEPQNSEITLREIPAGKRAAIRFSGRQTDERVAKHETRLRKWLKERGFGPLSNPTYAYYNDPLTPGPLRRNEVIFDLQ